jgi:hypothetical protein
VDDNPQKPKTQRLKSKPRSGPESGKDQRFARYGDQNPFSRLYKTEEGRAKVTEWRKKQKETGTGRKPGQPDGLTKDEFFAARDKAKAEAKIIVEIMSKENNIENEYAKEALGTAVEVMRMPGNVSARLSAAKLVLEYTKEKPSTKSEVTVQKAEDFLESILAKGDGS